jgi:hypothetical protein
VEYDREKTAASITMMINTTRTTPAPRTIRRSRSFAFAARSSSRCIRRRSALRRMSKRACDSRSPVSRREGALRSMSCRRASNEAFTVRKACARASSSRPHPPQRSAPIPLIRPQPGQAAVNSAAHRAHAKEPASFSHPHSGQRTCGPEKTAPHPEQRKPPLPSACRTAPQDGQIPDFKSFTDLYTGRHSTVFFSALDHPAPPIRRERRGTSLCAPFA